MPEQNVATGLGVIVALISLKGIHMIIFYPGSGKNEIYFVSRSMVSLSIIFA